MQCSISKCNHLVFLTSFSFNLNSKLITILSESSSAFAHYTSKSPEAFCYWQETRYYRLMNAVKRDRLTQQSAFVSLFFEDALIRRELLYFAWTETNLPWNAEEFQRCSWKKLLALQEVEATWQQCQIAKSQTCWWSFDARGRQQASRFLRKPRPRAEGPVCGFIFGSFSLHKLWRNIRQFELLNSLSVKLMSLYELKKIREQYWQQKTVYFFFLEPSGRFV